MMPSWFRSGIFDLPTSTGSQSSGLMISWCCKLSTSPMMKASSLLSGTASSSQAATCSWRSLALDLLRSWITRKKGRKMVQMKICLVRRASEPRTRGTSRTCLLMMTLGYSKTCCTRRLYPADGRKLFAMKIYACRWYATRRRVWTF